MYKILTTAVMAVGLLAGCGTQPAPTADDAPSAKIVRDWCDDGTRHVLIEATNPDPTTALAAELSTGWESSAADPWTVLLDGVPNAATEAATAADITVPGAPACATAPPTVSPSIAAETAEARSVRVVDASVVTPVEVTVPETTAEPITLAEPVSTTGEVAAVPEAPAADPLAECQAIAGAIAPGAVCVPAGDPALNGHDGYYSGGQIWVSAGQGAASIAAVTRHELGHASTIPVCGGACQQVIERAVGAGWVEGYRGSAKEAAGNSYANCFLGGGLPGYAGVDCGTLSQALATPGPRQASPADIAAWQAKIDAAVAAGCTLKPSGRATAYCPIGVEVPHPQGEALSAWVYGG